MKTFISLTASILLTASAGVILSSCLNDDQGYSLDDMWMSIATARPIDDSTFYLTLDDSTSLWPAAPEHIYYRPDRIQRVQINYTVLGDNFQGYDHAIKLNRIDTILTKTLAPDMAEDNDSIYGNDPIEVSDLWIGDGFLNVLFKAYFGGNIKHHVNLIPAPAADNTFDVEFRHNAFNDSSSRLQYGIVAFDLSEVSTDVKDGTITIRVNTFDGVQEIKKKYNTNMSRQELSIDFISLDKMK
ncbi:MAG: NigD-like protein [Tannerellaceae bacterium]|jgi:hypothetical protein|nr:NigD-like protein [Tannerellaceae bacterium]